MALRSHFTIAEIEHLDSFDQVPALLGWFDQIYYDPAAEERSGRKRRYRWPPGSPIDPLEELVEVFGRRIGRGVLERVASELRERSQDWRARPDEFPAADGERPLASFRAANSGGSRLTFDAQEARDEVLARLNALEAAFVIFHPPQPDYSHNNPPEPLDDGRATQAELDELRDAVAALRAEVSAKQPTPASVAREAGRLATWASKVASWTGERGTKFADAAMESSGKAAGIVVVLGAVGILPHIREVIEASEKFIALLQ